MLQFWMKHDINSQNWGWLKRSPGKLGIWQQPHQTIKKEPNAQWMKISHIPRNLKHTFLGGKFQDFCFGIGSSMNDEETLPLQGKLQLGPQNNIIDRNIKINSKWKQNDSYRGQKFLTWDRHKKCGRVKVLSSFFISLWKNYYTIKHMQKSADLFCSAFNCFRNKVVHTLAHCLKNKIPEWLKLKNALPIV